MALRNWIQMTEWFQKRKTRMEVVSSIPAVTQIIAPNLLRYFFRSIAMGLGFRSSRIK